ncbi:uncharacterized protein MONOS_4156 [Monocercomonoides exilis]|uniref:uncharacterized protein n=1 Tax=Monocercomonoides exilis TaxID=2049356 RepID=UPI0035594B78|nr:hypothetical protein MONOS_4156 [Monocercomonoides exilis]|eukprot:MONOS_4156.1-p1 / transcript=MONOS_4156.1 / gene=MONOS_4156 / organism=Monocercomonoides_exilis_PA203 / gene_product=unspecified product / transcript_product=unspecified product / location=Mono_scaffold00106:99803-102335(+) / protein_length=641 / sequence_SO=supercontig / SO=protein_coding / is_pseudo=false
MAHRVSNVLRNRHPYQQTSFKRDPTTIALAHGNLGLIKIKELLQNEELTEESKLETLHLLSPLLSNQETKLRAIMLELPLLVVSFLHSHIPETRMVAADIIGSISLVPQGIDMLMTTNVALTLSEMLRDRDIRCKKSAAKALWKMSETAEGEKLITSTGGCIQLISKAIIFPSIEMVICGIIQNVSQNEEAADIVSSCDILPRLMGVVERYTKNREAAVSAISSLFNCTRTNIGKRAAVENDFVMRAGAIVDSTLSLVPYEQSINAHDVTLECLEEVAEKTRHARRMRFLDGVCSERIIEREEMEVAERQKERDERRSAEREQRRAEHEEMGIPLDEEEEAERRQIEDEEDAMDEWMLQQQREIDENVFADSEQGQILTIRATAMGVLSHLMFSLNGRKAALPADTTPLEEDLAIAVTACAAEDKELGEIKKKEAEEARLREAEMEKQRLIEEAAKAELGEEIGAAEEGDENRSEEGGMYGDEDTQGSEDGETGKESYGEGKGDVDGMDSTRLSEELPDEDGVDEEMLMSDNVQVPQEIEQTNIEPEPAAPQPYGSTASSAEKVDQLSSSPIDLPLVSLMVDALLSCEPLTSWHAFSALAFLCELPAGKRAFLREAAAKNAHPAMVQEVLKFVGRTHRYL